MRIRKKKWAENELNNCEYFVKEPKLHKGKFNSLYKNKGPLHLDLGCGKGVFLAKQARDNKNINYLGIDISMDILGVARRNIEETFENQEKDNILITKYNIEDINDLFTKEDNIEKIYIYFCNPWPRARHHKRRLTYTKNLENYKTFLKDNGVIEFKTDNDDLFLSTKRYFLNEGFKIEEINDNLYDNKKLQNNLTEHEEKFIKENKTIKYIKAIKVTKR